MKRKVSYSDIDNPLRVSISLTPLCTFLMHNFVGAIGSSIATPTDLVKVRFQAEGRLLPGQSPRYSSTAAAFRQIWHAEGVRGLYVGVLPTVKRAAILTATQVWISILQSLLTKNDNQRINHQIGVLCRSHTTIWHFSK